MQEIPKNVQTHRKVSQSSPVSHWECGPPVCLYFIIVFLLSLHSGHFLVIKYRRFGLVVDDAIIHH